MPLVNRVSAAFRRLYSRGDTRREAAIPALDPAEEFQKIQRGLRRLSMASDRGSEILDAVSVRLDEVQQSLVILSRPRHSVYALDETELLELLDRLDRTVAIPDLPPAACSLIEGIVQTLLTGVGWRPVALGGAGIDSADIRIAEFLGEPSTDSNAGVHIERVLEQGYRRADGTLVRPGVVIVASTADTNNAQSTVRS